MIALANIACGALFWELFSVRRDVISRLSIATAYPALFLTAAAMLVGPWNVLRGRTNPVSSDLRRDLGIWAGIMALLHTGIGLNVHMRGRPWLYFIDQHHRVRYDLFGIGNDSGLLAAVLFLLLLAISNDLSLRRLGTRTWKLLQRWTCGHGANADARGRVSVRRETAGSIRRPTVGYHRRDCRAPGCGMVEDEAKGGRQRVGISSPTIG
jgi:DMSO/TMAO reductase YedYZ heme-binding membrane subunit